MTLFRDYMLRPRKAIYISTDYARCAEIEKAIEEVVEAAELQDAAEDAYNNCEECGGEGVPELCPECFPLFDRARLSRWNALAALRKAADSK